MRIVFLGTPSKHRTYLINRLAAVWPITAVLFERRRLTKAYPTGPFFESEEAAYEERFFEPCPDGVARELLPAVRQKWIDVHSVNQPGMREYLGALAPDVIISSGVGPVSPEIYELAKWAAINIHLGLSQHYRGLDSNLWAIYEERFDCMGVTLHHLERELDTGAIVAQGHFAAQPGDKIFHLRHKATILAAQLLLEVAGELARTRGNIRSWEQPHTGKYLSAMSLIEKEIALQKFDSYQSTLGVQC